MENGIADLSKHIIGWDYEEALEDFLKRRLKMETTYYTFENAYIRVNKTIESKIDAVKRWLELGPEREWLIFVHTSMEWIKKGSDMTMTEIRAYCVDCMIQVIEVVAVEQHIDNGKGEENND